MTPARAREIVIAINNRLLFKLELVDAEKIGSLEGVSLAEMIEAKSIIQAANARAEANARERGSSYSITMVPDDRLIAAAYALEHYHPDNEAVVVIPTTEWPYDRRALGVVGLEPQPDTDEVST